MKDLLLRERNANAKNIEELIIENISDILEEYPGWYIDVFKIYPPKPMCLLDSGIKQIPFEHNIELRLRAIAVGEI
jgi:hypothetical protein